MKSYSEDASRLGLRRRSPSRRSRVCAAALVAATPALHEVTDERHCPQCTTVFRVDPIKVPERAFGLVARYVGDLLPFDGLPSPLRDATAEVLQSLPRRGGTSPHPAHLRPPRNSWFSRCCPHTGGTARPASTPVGLTESAACSAIPPRTWSTGSRPLRRLRPPVPATSPSFAIPRRRSASGPARSADSALPEIDRPTGNRRRDSIIRFCSKIRRLGPPSCPRARIRLVVYYPEKRQRGLAEGNPQGSIRGGDPEELRRSIRNKWVKRLAGTTPYFTEALNEILAGGSPAVRLRPRVDRLHLYPSDQSGPPSPPWADAASGPLCT